MSFPGIHLRHFSQFFQYLNNCGFIKNDMEKKFSNRQQTSSLPRIIILLQILRMLFCFTTQFARPLVSTWIFHFPQATGISKA